MKKIIYLLLLICLAAAFQCKLWKSEKDDHSDLIVNENQRASNIDFKGLYDKIKKSDKIDIDVFIAISVLHKNYVEQFISESEAMSEPERLAFYDSKKKDFFKTIKFKEDEYVSYMEKNLDKLNEYQNLHPEIREYLTTFN